MRTCGVLVNDKPPAEESGTVGRALDDTRRFSLFFFSSCFRPGDGS